MRSQLQGTLDEKLRLHEESEGLLEQIRQLRRECEGFQCEIQDLQRQVDAQDKVSVQQQEVISQLEAKRNELEAALRQELEAQKLRQLDLGNLKKISELEKRQVGLTEQLQEKERQMQELSRARLEQTENEKRLSAKIKEKDLEVIGLKDKLLRQGDEFRQSKSDMERSLQSEIKNLGAKVKALSDQVFTLSEAKLKMEKEV